MQSGISNNDFASAYRTAQTPTPTHSAPFVKRPQNNLPNVRPIPSTDKLRRGQPMQVEKPDSGLREHGRVEPGALYRVRGRCRVTQPATSSHGTNTRAPNTQTAAERTLWRKIRRHMSAQRRRKRQLYGLSSNREADLFIPRHFQPIAKRTPRSRTDNIIPFPPPPSSPSPQS